jgi:hypothetical protein
MPSVRAFLRFLPLLPFLFAASVISGCTRAQAKVTPDQPLDVPAPPPREVEVADSEPPPPVALVPEPARNAPPRPRPTPSREPPRVELPRPDAKPEPPAEPPKPAEEIKPPASPPAPLQTTPATAEGEVERAIRASLTKANADLNRIDYRALNRDARTQYDTAKRFILQSERALHEKNLSFAKSVADKAAALAAQLAGR